MDGPDAFLTLARAATAEPPRTKGSRFIAHAAPVESEAETLALVAHARRRHHAASHHVRAYRLGEAGERERSSDDGEPGGSSGPPVLREIAGRGLTGVVVVVTRYYGGTKLGTGGLARAYGEAAALALDAGGVSERILRVGLRLRYAFADTAAAMRTLARFDVLAGEAAYDEDGASVRVRVRRSEASALAAAFVEASSGRGIVEAEAEA